jgi:hypothetical protein
MVGYGVSPLQAIFAPAASTAAAPHAGPPGTRLSARPTRLETAAARGWTQPAGPKPSVPQPRRGCQGDRRRMFPRRAPPPGQSDRRSPEPRFSLFRSHFRPRTGGSAASAEGPSAGGLWDGVGPGRWRKGARPAAAGAGAEVRGFQSLLLRGGEQRRPGPPFSECPPGRLEPGGGCGAVLSPTAAAPGALRRLLRGPRSGPGPVSEGGKREPQSRRAFPRLPSRRRRPGRCPLWAGLCPVRKARCLIPFSLGSFAPETRGHTF